MFLAWAVHIVQLVVTMGLGGASGAEAGLTGPGSTLAYRCTEEYGHDPTLGDCYEPPVPTMRFGNDGVPITNHPVDDEDQEWDARRRIETINAAIDAMDDFLFSHADPDAWSDEQAEAFENLVNGLESVCAPAL